MSIVIPQNTRVQREHAIAQKWYINGDYARALNRMASLYFTSDVSSDIITLYAKLVQLFVNETVSHAVITSGRAKLNFTDFAADGRNHALGEKILNDYTNGKLLSHIDTIETKNTQLTHLILETCSNRNFPQLHKLFTEKIEQILYSTILPNISTLTDPQISILKLYLSNIVYFESGRSGVDKFIADLKDDQIKQLLSTWIETYETEGNVDYSDSDDDTYIEYETDDDEIEELEKPTTKETPVVEKTTKTAKKSKKHRKHQKQNKNADNAVSTLNSRFQLTKLLKQLSAIVSSIPSATITTSLLAIVALIFRYIQKRTK